ncbi:MAG: hypothetical protein M3P97_07005 [Actinomycetota bacterium]|nr:hypothetical protein [Actinomycetota bacterium]
MSDPMGPEERVVREERVVERGPAPARGRRIVIERRIGGGPGFGMNPLGAVIAGALIIFILVLVFGFLL